MNTLEAYELISAVKDSLSTLRGEYDVDRQTKKFLEALHERGLSIVGQAKPVAAPALHEVA
jgi:hypothetical protein